MRRTRRRSRTKWAVVYGPSNLILASGFLTLAKAYAWGQRCRQTRSRLFLGGVRLRYREYQRLRSQHFDR